MRCPIHPGSEIHMIYRDYHSRSQVDLSHNTLTLHINVAFHYLVDYDYHRPDCWPEFAHDGSHRQMVIRYQGDPWNQTERNASRDHFQDRIYHHWNGPLELRPTHGAHADLACRIELHFVATDHNPVHLRVRVLNRPHATSIVQSPGAVPIPNQANEVAFRASCWATRPPGQFDMNLNWQGNGGWDHLRNVPRPDGSIATGIPQNTVAHEFGHYLPLDHTCQVPGADIGWCASVDPHASAYCEYRPEHQFRSIMALGNDIWGEHGVPWRNRLLNLHHYGCQHFFEPHLV